MPDRKITLRRNNSGTSEAMYPTTTVDQIYSSNGATAAFDSNSKLKYDFLPDGIIGGLKFQSAVAAADVNTDDEIALLIKGVVDTYGLEGAVGSYWISNGITNWGAPGGYVTPSTGGSYDYAWGEQDPGEEGGSGADTFTVESGDWVVIQSITQSGSTNDYDVVFAIVNNTYQDAANNKKGIVELATNAETSTGTDTTRAVTPAGLASVLSGYSTTDNDTTYSVSLGGVDDNVTIVLTAGGSGSGTDSVSLTVGNNMALNKTGDTVEFSSTDTNDYLDGITKSSNTLTFSVGSKSDVTFDFGANAFTSTTIPSVTLNGSATTSPSFYASTASGTAGSSTVSRQALFSNGSGSAPTFVDAPKIFYDTTTGWLHGDIVFDDDATT